MFKKITSTQNSYIKELVQLKEKSKVRTKKGLFLIEGYREISLAIQGKYAIHTVIFNNEITSIDTVNKLIENIDAIDIIEVPFEVYKKIALRESTEGVIAIAKQKNHQLENLEFNKKNPLILIAEAPEKPGNIGALLRTADAAAVDAVIIANPKTDLYNGNIIRSSVGCIFTTNVAIGSTNEIIEFLKKNSINIYGAALTASVPYDTIDYNQPSAIVVGTEATGLSNEWLQNSTKNIIIPMNGKIDSMNVSVSAAIIVFEAVRQRIITN
ncbi:RNA methyltransferase, TrmH family [Lutibacter oricola]|uniref:RNA methyltransferase, TrmH family n=1 Tax=Lutibacter oricola TaxID=762486 RepID=A0A1H2X9H9_9FLAO|nr:TrmH family RNA methyltransferase [Lutibacter oricola]SDW89457.1 RNA methyltransferase, TrmH family [Lutibacter oricola]